VFRQNGLIASWQALIIRSQAGDSQPRRALLGCAARSTQGGEAEIWRPRRLDQIPALLDCRRCLTPTNDVGAALLTTHGPRRRGPLPPKRHRCRGFGFRSDPGGAGLPGLGTPRRMPSVILEDGVWAELPHPERRSRGGEIRWSGARSFRRALTGWIIVSRCRGEASAIPLGGPAEDRSWIPIHGAHRQIGTGPTSLCTGLEV